MKSFLRIFGIRALAALLTATFAAAACAAQPEMPKPTAEHEILKQFAGEWTTKATCVMAPGEEPMTCVGTESAEMLGGFWLVGRNEGSMQDMKVTNLLTIGYDPTKKQYIGTFICSAGSELWHYTGKSEANGKKLVLETEGPSPLDPTKHVKYREILELVAADHKVFTSYIIGDDGKLTEFAKIEYRRKK